MALLTFKDGTTLAYSEVLIRAEAVLIVRDAERKAYIVNKSRLKEKEALADSQDQPNSSYLISK